MKRASSTIYYAIFHAAAKCCADALIGPDSVDRTERAWLQVYRSLDHGTAAKRCKRHEIDGFPAEIGSFADAFASMQVKRHSCDYDPTHKVARTDVMAELRTVKTVIDDLEKAPIKHKRAFAAFLVINIR